MSLTGRLTSSTTPSSDSQSPKQLERSGVYTSASLESGVGHQACLRRTANSRQVFDMNIHDLLEQHDMEMVQTISGDFKELSDDAVMFRVDPDVVQDVVKNKGFEHLPARSSKSAGIGGIYFWPHLGDAVKYATADHSNFFFMVARPTSPCEVIHFSRDFLLKRRQHVVVSDTYLHGVHTYIVDGQPDPRDEYVKAGIDGDIFLPTALAIIRKKKYDVKDVEIEEQANGT